MYAFSSEKHFKKQPQSLSNTLTSMGRGMAKAGVGFSPG
jgi:hypothetical protein